MRGRRRSKPESRLSSPGENAERRPSNSLPDAHGKIRQTYEENTRWARIMRIDRFEQLERLELLEMSCHHLQAQDSLRVAVKNLLHQIIRIAQLIPFFEKTIIRDARIVTAKHDLIFEPSLNVPLQRFGKIFRRPAR